MSEKVYTLTLNVSSDPANLQDGGVSDTQHETELIATLIANLENYVAQKGNSQLSVVSVVLNE